MNQFSNFNTTKKPEYDLNSSLTKEMISLYGIVVKLLIIERVNQDKTVFGDYSHLKSNSEGILEIPVLPENTENWDDSGYVLSSFGPINLENITLFVHRSYFKDIIEIQKITGNILVFPNNKIMEITSVDATVPGVNNLFTFQDAKTVLKLSCKPYDYKLINELSSGDISYRNEEPLNPDYSSGDYESLEKYFTELISKKDDNIIDFEVTANVDAVERGKTEDKSIRKSIIDRTVDDVWGSFK